MLNLSIGISGERVKALEETLRQAYGAGDAKWVQRVTALLGISRPASARWRAVELGCSVARLYWWLKHVLYEGPESLKVDGQGGRPSKLSKPPKGRRCDRIQAGSVAGGFTSACWKAAMLQELIQREFGVLYKVHSVSEWLGNLGFSFHKARCVSDQLDAAQRRVWLKDTGPKFVAPAQAAQGRVLFGDAARLAQWGSLGFTGAPIGQQPLIKTTGKGKAYQLLGAIDCVSGRLF